MTAAASAPASSRSGAASGRHKSGSRIQSAMHFCSSTVSGRTGQEVTAQRSARCLAAPARAQTMTSFSFARVMATYSTRSSSAFASRRS